MSMDKKYGAIGILTFTMIKAGSVPLTNLVKILSFFSNEIYIITGADTSHPNPYEGDIELYLPEETSANLTMRSRQGDLFSDFNLVAEESRPRISGSGEGTKYELDNWTKGKLNRGGVEIIMSTYYGNISVKKK